MRIRIKLYIMTACSVLMLLLVAGTLEVSTREVNAAMAENGAAHDIMRTLFELSGQTSDYLLHGNERAKIQWTRKHSSLMRLANEAATSCRENRAIRRQILSDCGDLATAFEGVVHSQKMITEANSEAAVVLKQRYIGQLNTRIQMIVSQATDLDRRSSARVADVRRQARTIFVVVAIILAGFMVVVSVLFDRSVVRPMRQLQMGTTIIGSGNLNHKVATGSKDEIGALSRAFDEMTERLKGVTVSRDELAREVIERKRAEDAARWARRSAEAANQAKSQFLTNMSHELRTPLNSVIGFSNVLGKNKSGHLDGAEMLYVQRIVANGKHLLFLINQILDLAKIEVRKVQVEWKIVDLRVLVQQVIGQLEVSAQAKSIRLVTDVPAATPTMFTDPVKLTQVLINLIGNAIKFTESGEVRVVVVLSPSGDRPCRIEVHDTGIGIAPERLAVIFEAFQQAESGIARKYGGTGLGLTISRALCELMGYRIEVASEPGKGSIFSIVIPQKVGEPVSPGVGDMPSGPVRERVLKAGGDGGKGKLVLVIDDESDARILLSNLVEEAGCRVMVASSGETGLRMAREFHPDAITLDLLMPTMNGWSFLRELDSDPELRDIPVVVVSVVLQEHCGMVLGAVDVLQKPVTREALIAVLKRIVHPPGRDVLVVDDNEDDRRLMSLNLEGSDYSVRMASSGQEALQMMAVALPDALVVDLIMPGMDGSTLIHRIRADDRYRHLPIVIVTGRDLTADERRMLRLQAYEVLSKSGNLEAELPRTLARILSLDA
jgi:signal transduction histidine kinase/DNA-binding response OmpR family regulator